jgi:hypothetical protein
MTGRTVDLAFVLDRERDYRRTERRPDGCE